MKPLIVGVLLAIMQTPPPVPRQATYRPTGARSDPQPKTKHSKTVATQPQPSQHPIQANDANADTTNKVRANAQEPIVIRETVAVPSARDWWDRAYVLAAIALVLVGAIAAWLAWRTLRAIEGQLFAIQAAGRQTDSLIEQAGKQAEAALLNAQTVINSERPWMFIEIKVFEVSAQAVGDPPAHLGFAVQFRNAGKTPAEIVNFEQHPDCRDNTRDLPDLPEYSSDRQIMIHTRLVAPGETWRDPGESAFSESGLLDDQWQDIRRSKKRFIYWGRLQYRDLVKDAKTIHEMPAEIERWMGTIHETCFSYFWSPRTNEFYPCGPFGYNKHT